jgi:hypothetical protein
MKKSSNGGTNADMIGKGKDKDRVGSVVVQTSGRSSTIPPKAGVGGAIIDGPFGGKKPQS